VAIRFAVFETIHAVHLIVGSTCLVYPDSVRCIGAGGVSIIHADGGDTVRPWRLDLPAGGI